VQYKHYAVTVREIIRDITELPPVMALRAGLQESEGDVQNAEESVTWRYEWDAALDESRHTRRAILIDVMKVP